MDEGLHQGKDPPHESHIQACSSTVPDPGTLPYGVTLPPTLLPRRTPFDHYKHKSGIRQPEHVALRLGTPEAEVEAIFTEEINDLLREIDDMRHGAAETTEQERAQSQQKKTTAKTELRRDPTQLLQAEGRNEPLRSDPSLLYPPRKAESSKDKNHAGTKKKRGREGERTTSARRDPPPSPPRTRTQVPHTHSNRRSPPLRDGTRYGLLVADAIRSDRGYDGDQYGHDQLAEDTQVILPDRPTISHFSPAYISPFARYLGIPPAPDRPPPFRPVHTRLGISKSEFDALLTAEIDEVLVAMRRIEGGPATRFVIHLTLRLRLRLLLLFRKMIA